MDYYFNIIYLLQNENIPFNVSVQFYKNFSKILIIKVSLACNPERNNVYYGKNVHNKKI